MLDDILLAELTKQGLWAILYVTLFIYTLRENRRYQEVSKERENQLRSEYHALRSESREREEQLTQFIHSISQQFERLAVQYEKIAKDVQEIKIDLLKK